MALTAWVVTWSFINTVGLNSLPSKSSFPASIFDRSRMSLISTFKLKALTSAMLMNFSVSGCKRCRFNIASAPKIPLSGVRISWLMLEINWLLTLLFSTASLRADSNSWVRLAILVSSTWFILAASCLACISCVVSRKISANADTLFDNFIMLFVQW